jgi:hypothetical protein
MGSSFVKNKSNLKKIIRLNENYLLLNSNHCANIRNSINYLKLNIYSRLINKKNWKLIHFTYKKIKSLKVTIRIQVIQIIYLKIFKITIVETRILINNWKKCTMIYF